MFTASSEGSRWESSCEILENDDEIVARSTPEFVEANLILIFNLVTFSRDFIIRQCELNKVFHVLIK